MVHLRWLSLRQGEDIKAHLYLRLKLQLERERQQQHCSIAHIIVRLLFDPRYQTPPNEPCFYPLECQ